MWIGIAAAIGALVGLALTHSLATLNYRRPDERELPHPHQPWWLVPALAATWALLTWRHQDQAWPNLTLCLPLTAALGWLSAVDLDVQRLPNPVVIPSAAWSIAVIAAHTLRAGSPAAAIAPLAVGAATGLAAWILHLISRGSLGFGDVKLVSVLSASLAMVAPQLVVPALLCSCVIAAATALVLRQRELPFGPSMAAAFTLALVCA